MFGWKALAIVLASVILQGPAFAAEAVPRHVLLARELVANVLPEANEYAHRGRFSLPADGPAAGYASRTDCSGLIHELLSRAGSPAVAEMATVKTRRHHPLAEDFTLSIEREKGFRKISRVDDLQAGDIIAYAWIDPADARATGSTGHVMLVNSDPRRIEPAAPIIEGLTQFEVSIIDSSRSWLGPDDTRILSKQQRINGLGQGRIRLYAEADGRIVGFAKTFKNSKLHPLLPGPWSAARPKAGGIGRPNGTS